MNSDLCYYVGLNIIGSGVSMCSKSIYRPILLHMKLEDSLWPSLTSSNYKAKRMDICEFKFTFMTSASIN